MRTFKHVGRHWTELKIGMILHHKIAGELLLEYWHHCVSRCSGCRTNYTALGPGGYCFYREEDGKSLFEELDDLLKGVHSIKG